MTDTPQDDKALQGGSGSQGLLWAIALVTLFAGIVTLIGDDAEAMGIALLNLGGFSFIIALAVQAIRAALK